MSVTEVPPALPSADDEAARPAATSFDKHWYAWAMVLPP